MATGFLKGKDRRRLHYSAAKVARLCVVGKCIFCGEVLRANCQADSRTLNDDCGVASVSILRRPTFFSRDAIPITRASGGEYLCVSREGVERDSTVGGSSVCRFGNGS